MAMILPFFFMITYPMLLASMIKDREAKWPWEWDWF